MTYPAPDPDVLVAPLVVIGCVEAVVLVLLLVALKLVNRRERA